MIEVSVQTRQAAALLIRELNEFEKSSAIREGLVRGARLLIRRGRIMLRSRLLSSKGSTGGLLRSFAVVYRRRQLMSVAGFIAQGRHAHLVDRGTKRRKTKRGYDRGAMPANYFWTDTQTLEKANVERELLLGIEEAVNRLRNRIS